MSHFTSIVKSAVFLCFLFCCQAMNAEKTNICIDANLENLNMNPLSCFTAPVMDCASVYFGCPGDDIDPSVIGFTTAVPGEPTCPTPVVTYEDVLMTDTPCEQVIKRVWTAEYPDDASPWLISTCTQTIFLSDSGAPAISHCPDNIGVNLGTNGCDFTATWEEPEASDDCGVTSFTSNFEPGDTFDEGTNTVVYIATDGCGQFTDCVFEVYVVGSCCTDPPSISCPPALMLCPGSSTLPNDSGTATYSPSGDMCASPTIGHNDVIVPISGSLCGGYEITRTWTATDPETGLSSSCDQIIMVDDNKNPTFSNIPEDIYINGSFSNSGSSCAVNVEWMPPVAADNCTVDEVVSTHQPGDSFNEGITTVTYTVTDDCGLAFSIDFDVIVECECGIAPEITCPAKYYACPFTDYSPSASGIPTVMTGSGCSDPIVLYVDTVLEEGPCDGQLKVKRMWTATDPDNSALTNTCKQIIKLMDVDDPWFFNVPSNMTLTGSGSTCETAAYWTPPSTNDNCGVATLTSTHEPGDIFNSGATEVIYTVTDNCGNSANYSFTINVDCSCLQAPNIECPPNYYSCPGANYDTSVAGYATGSPGADGCGEPIITYEDKIISTGPCAGELRVRRRWKATDPNNPNLYTMCKQMIKLRDKIGPVVGTAPSNISLSSESCPMVVNWIAPIFTDNCGMASITSSHNPGDSFPEGTTAITYTATDDCGNETNYSFNITIECLTGCQEPPSIVCPDDITICMGMSYGPSIAGVPTATAGIDCDEPIVTYLDKIIGEGNCAGSQIVERTWLAADPTDPTNFTSCIQLISLDDVEAPTVTGIGCPDNIVMTVGGTNCSKEITWMAPVFGDNCSKVSPIGTHASGDTFTEGTTTVTYTATDPCGNVGSCSFEVQIICDAGCIPLITCPDDITLCPGTSYGPSIAGVAISTAAHKNCWTPVVTYEDELISTGSCAGSKVVERTWTSTDPDDDSLFSSCVQTITLDDISNPVVSNCPNNIEVIAMGENCSSNVTWSGPSFSDHCSSVDVESTHISGNTFNEGITNVSYTGTDNCGNISTCSFIVSVVCEGCLTAPSIACPGNHVKCPGISYGPSFCGEAIGTAATSLCQTPIVSYLDNVITTGPCVGAKMVQRVWTATDPINSDLTSSCTQMIELIDEEAPILESDCPANITTTISGSDETANVTWSAPTYSDDCSSLTITSSAASGDSFNIGLTTVSYTASDDCGNENISCSFIVNVLWEGCTTAPTISCPIDITLCPNDSYGPSIAGEATGTAAGALCETPIVTYVDNILSTGPCSGASQIERTWTATDPIDNTLSVSCTQLITRIDNTAPELTTACPSNITETITGGDDSIVITWTAPSYSDNCSSVNIVSTHNSGDNFEIGLTTVSYSASDDCGNENETCSFIVNVIWEGCTIPPTITCPSNATLCPGEDYSPSITGTAVGTEAGSDCWPPIITYVDDIVSSGPCAGAKVIERTWTATDPDDISLYSQCVQIITLADELDPVPSNCPNHVVMTIGGVGCSKVITWTNPTFEDNCSDVTITSSHDSGDTFFEGITNVFITGTDDCGNANACYFTVNITCDAGCTSPPNLTCPSDITICPGLPYGPAVAGEATTSPSSADCWPPILTYTDVVVSTGSCAGTKVIERNWVSTDPDDASLMTVCIQTITIEDNTNPILANTCPADIFMSIGGDCEKEITWTVPSFTDNCSTADVTSTHMSGDTFYEGVTQVTYTAEDACGNTSTCSFEVEIECTEGCVQPPNITCPPNASLCLSSSYGPSITGYAVTTPSSPDCWPPILNFSDVIVSTGPCPGAKEIVRTWTSTDPDDATLESTCTQVIYIGDSGDPIIHCPANIVESEYGQPTTWTTTTSDDCSTVTVSCNYASGTVFPVGTTTVNCTATDECGNTNTCSFTVTVPDEGNSFTCQDDINVDCGPGGGEHVTWDAPTFTSSCGDCSGGAPISGFMYMGEFNGSQYYCSTSPKAWEVGQAHCASVGGHLAVINSAEENAFLANILTIQSAYIGCSDASNEGYFEWVNGDPVDYTNWYVGQPNNYNGNQDYVEMLSDGTWNDQYATSQLEYIMEIPCSYVVQTGGPSPGSFFSEGCTTITYTANDGCSTPQTCSFDVCVNAAITITCPDDVTLTCPTNSGMTVNWETPHASTCCDDCTSGSGISGFVYMGSYQGHHYYCSTAPATWNTAQSHCASLGGHLAVVNNAEENAYLANLLTIQSAYIGLSDATIEGNFEWVNGDPLTYSNWYAGQPNNYNGNQDYVEMMSDGTWNDQYATTQLEYIMEIPGCINIQQTGGPATGSVFQPGTTTTITYEATDNCGNWESCSFDITVEESACNSGGTDDGLTWIENIQFANIDNTSWDDGGYGDYTDQCATITQGNTYPISLTPGYASSNALAYWMIWIDFNMDGDYLDSGEFIAYGNGPGSINGDITMPQTLWNGTTTMRVAMKIGSYPTSPCELFAFGETEDYCVHVVGGGDAPENGNSTENRESEEATELFGSNVEIASDINVFPNPVGLELTVEIASNVDVVSANVYDVRGRVYKTIPSDGLNTSIKLNVQNFAEGIYMIHVKLENGETLSEKFIVKH